MLELSRCVTCYSIQIVISTNLKVLSTQKMLDFYDMIHTWGDMR